MSKHVAYWTDLLDKDVAVAFGAVATHRAFTAWAVVEAPDEQGSRILAESSPVISTGLLSMRCSP
jgi:hypothetical protein